MNIACKLVPLGRDDLTVPSSLLFATFLHFSIVSVQATTEGTSTNTPREVVEKSESDYSQFRQVPNSDKREDFLWQFSGQHIPVQPPIKKSQNFPFGEWHTQFDYPENQYLYIKKLKISPFLCDWSQFFVEKKCVLVVIILSTKFAISCIYICVNLGTRSYKNCSVLMLPKEAGIAPLSAFFWSSKFVRLFRLPRDDGIDPVKLFWNNILQNINAFLSSEKLLYFEATSRNHAKFLWKEAQGNQCSYVMQFLQKTEVLEPSKIWNQRAWEACIPQIPAKSKNIWIYL